MMTHETNDRIEKLIHIARSYGSKYRHAVGMWTNDEHTKSVTAKSLCGRDGWYGESCICDGDEVGL
jgi:hypothetical protein